VLGLLLGLAIGIALGTTALDSDESTVQLPPNLGAQPAGQAGAAESTPDAVEGNAQADVSIEGRPFRGPEDARVTLVEFTDYQCPFCEQHFKDTLPQLEREYGERVRYVVRNFPLENIHPAAAKAAEAAECAFDQDKFFEYHDVLFQNQKSLRPNDLKRYAREVGLDGERFDSCLDSGEKSKQVEKDLEDGRAYGVTGTPTFFVNGRKLEGAQPFGNIAEELDKALEESG
jgi:protein-disulfide isomerase